MEGQFIAYRVVIKGLSVGVHTLDFHYNANTNNPCSDVLPSSECIPANPSDFVTVPAASLVKCDASSGTFSGSQSRGRSSSMDQLVLR